jgi:hypothetical protein
MFSYLVNLTKLYEELTIVKKTVLCIPNKSAPWQNYSDILILSALYFTFNNLNLIVLYKLLLPMARFQFVNIFCPKIKVFRKIKIPAKETGEWVSVLLDGMAFDEVI